MNEPGPELAVNETHDGASSSVQAASANADFGAISGAAAPAASDVPEFASTGINGSGGSRRALSQAMSAAIAPMIAIVSWFVPGLGHLLLRRWQRALAFFVAVGGLAVTGYLMRGNVFAPQSPDPFGTLGFVADASSGIFYLFAHVIERSGPDVARAMGDYGTRFIAGAGIVNLLGVCDAYEVARGRKH